MTRYLSDRKICGPSGGDRKSVYFLYGHVKMLADVAVRPWKRSNIVASKFWESQGWGEVRVEVSAISCGLNFLLGFFLLFVWFVQSFDWLWLLFKMSCCTRASGNCFEVEVWLTGSCFTCFRLWWCLQRSIAILFVTDLLKVENEAAFKAWLRMKNFQSAIKTRKLLTKRCRVLTEGFHRHERRSHRQRLLAR